MWQVFGMLYEMFQKDGIDYFTGEKKLYKTLLAALYKALLAVRLRQLVGLMNDGNLHLITVMSFCQTL